MAMTTNRSRALDSLVTLFSEEFSKDPWDFPLVKHTLTDLVDHCRSEGADLNKLEAFLYEKPQPLLLFMLFHMNSFPDDCDTGPDSYIGQMGQLIEIFLKGGGSPQVISDSSYSALQYAVSRGHESIADLLIGHGADLYYHDRHQCNILHEAAECENEHMMPFLCSQVDLIRLCGLDEEGKTALHTAISLDRKDAALSLIKHGFPLYHPDYLHLCCKFHDDTRLIEGLLQAGMPLHHKIYGSNVLDKAARCRNKPALQIFIERGYPDVFTHNDILRALEEAKDGSMYTQRYAETSAYLNQVLLAIEEQQSLIREIDSARSTPADTPTSQVSKDAILLESTISSLSPSISTSPSRPRL